MPLATDCGTAPGNPATTDPSELLLASQDAAPEVSDGLTACGPDTGGSAVSAVDVETISGGANAELTGQPASNDTPPAAA
ncbi:hypothetical protein CCR75_002274 [Bremia lactucae]|uniref:Uncharacterized protein n=1 Tax=Bremia lactucae TaxID=4779 RepID=A0A976IFH3_BRELC|nr:hypothetical protein CCR75_002274 [Bremia lactucae]